MALSVGLIFSILIMGLYAQEFTYVGTGKCKICHKTEKQERQFSIWEDSQHSKACKSIERKGQ